MHNAYMPSNSNSTFAVEINYTPVKGLGIYAQILLDNFSIPFFNSGAGPNLSEASTQDAKAYLVGAKYVTSAANGTLTINPEVVYVMPYTYLRDSEQAGYPYGIDYVAAVKNRLYSYEDIGTSTDVLYDEYVIGYTYGPDCLVANLSATWEKDKLTLGGKAFFMMHGTHDLWTIWSKVPTNTSEEDYNSQYTGVSTSHKDNGNYRYGDSVKTERNSIWYTLDIGLSAKYDVLENLSVSAAVDFVNMKNIYNVKGQDAHDFQVILGVSYSPF
jgi:hypothetical protein